MITYFGCFFPAAGIRLYKDGESYGRQGEGRYWSSSKNNATGAHFFMMSFVALNVESYSIAHGGTIRCVALWS